MMLLSSQNEVWHSTVMMTDSQDGSAKVSQLWSHHVSFCCCYLLGLVWIFEAGFLCVALVVVELTL